LGDDLLGDDLLGDDLLGDDLLGDDLLGDDLLGEGERLFFDLDPSVFAACVVFFGGILCKTLSFKVGKNQDNQSFF